MLDCGCVSRPSHEVIHPLHQFKWLPAWAERFQHVSPVADRHMMLKIREKKEVTRIMRFQAPLFGLRFLSSCLMTNHCHLRPNAQKCPARGNLPEAISGTDRALLSIAWNAVIPAQGDHHGKLFGRAETCTEGVGRIAKRVAKRELIKNVVGRMAFLEDVFAKVRGSIGGRRNTGSRQMRGISGSKFTLRDLLRGIVGEA